MSPQAPMSRTVAIVDPFEAGALYAPAFRARGWDCHCVLAAPPLPGDERRATFVRQDFERVIDLADGFEAAVEGLASQRVAAVLAGHEHGVLAADQLADELSLPRNKPKLSVARRDKALMAERAAAAGVAVPAQRCSADASTLLAWVRARGSWPVVAKPPRGSGSHQVERCASEAELAAALGRILAGPDAFGEVNDRALVQEDLLGDDGAGDPKTSDEFAVDTVSWDGRHALSAVWSYRRRKGAPSGPIELFDAKELLPGEDERSESLFTFTCRALDALGIRFGPAHSEVMLVRGEPVLIEVGARAHGGIAAHELARLATGDSQVDQVVRAIVDQRLPARPTTFRGRALLLVLKNRLPGASVDPQAARQIAALRVVRKVQWNCAPGSPAPSVAGLAWLVGQDGAQVAAAENAVREIERASLYRPAPEPHLAAAGEP